MVFAGASVLRDRKVVSAMIIRVVAGKLLYFAFTRKGLEGAPWYILLECKAPQKVSSNLSFYGAKES